MYVEIDYYSDDNWQIDTIERAVKAALEYEHVNIDCGLEIIISSEDEIRECNRDNRNIDAVTDVLSFPMFESKDKLCVDESGVAFLGSMVICKNRACQQAEEYGHSIEREAAFLAVHSVLHLLGYDHEKGKAEESEMFAKQELILNSIGLTR